MIGRSAYKEGESSYLLEYEQKKIRDCAKTLHNLAEAFEAGGKEEKEENEDRKQMILKNRLRETRALMADHLKEVARIVADSTKEEIHMIRFGEKKEKQIGKMLYTEGIILEDLCLAKKKDGKKEIIARLYQTSLAAKKKVCSLSEVSEFLSILLDMRLQNSVRNPFFLTEKVQTYYFEEECKYMVLTGFAKAVKEDENISGDNHCFFETQEKEFICLLSDGMGSGKKAYEESEEVIDKVECFIESGFHKEKAIQMLNDTFLIEGEGRNMSTLDMCSIDLYTGKAQFYKVGAAYSLIKRDRYVEKVPSISLPLGLFHDMEMGKQEKKLLEEDYVILFSDGVLDHFAKEEGEESLKELVSNVPYSNPTQIASYLMKHAISRGGGKIGDDMTILVMGIWENKGAD